MTIAKLAKYLLGYNMKIVIYLGESGVISEIDCSIWKMLKKGTFSLQKS